MRKFEIVTKTQFPFPNYNFITILGDEVPNRPKADNELNGIISILGILSV